MNTRVYVPGDWEVLGAAVGPAASGDGAGRRPAWSGVAHAVTADLRQQWPDGDDEEWEYAAAQEAANDSLANLRGEDGAPRRLVLAVDVATTTEVVADRPTAVRVRDVEVPADVVAYLVDDAAAVRDVRDAVRRLGTGGTDEDLEEVLSRCAQHQLAWYDATEVDVVLALGTEPHDA